MQGHVDGVGSVLARTPGEHWEVVRIALPSALARYVVEKGSIAVDGVSLTVSAVERRRRPRALVRGQPDPHHPPRDHAGRRAPRGIRSTWRST